MLGLLVDSSLPLCRLYLRYFPGAYFKENLFRILHWRSRNYICRTSHGFKMKGVSSDLVQGYIYYFGQWEPNLSSFISSRLEGDPRRIFVDVGANVGYFSLLAANFINKDCVVAIEAHPLIFGKLLDNFALNDCNQIVSFQRTVSCKSGLSNIYHGGLENEGASTIVADKFQGKPLEVLSDTLDALLQKTEIERIKLIKVDVEGAEYGVIKGAAQTLLRLPDDAEVIIEITPSESNDNAAFIFDVFLRAGYHPYLINNRYDAAYYIGRNEVERPVRISSIPKFQCDIVFSKIFRDIL
jgi:FkbM family methyltransferase